MERSIDEERSAQFPCVCVCVRVCFCRLTSRHAVEANFNLRGPQRRAAGQAAEHGLHRITLGLLALHEDLLIQLYRLVLHEAACEETEGR